MPIAETAVRTAGVRCEPAGIDGERARDEREGHRHSSRRCRRGTGDAHGQPSRPRDATRRAHGPTATSSRIFSSVAGSDNLPRDEVIDRRERLLLARGDDLGDRDRADPGQRVELLRGCPVQVDRPDGLALRRCAAGRARHGGLASHGDVHLVAIVDGSREVELPIGECRIDARAEAVTGIAVCFFSMFSLGEISVDAIAAFELDSSASTCSVRLNE